MTTPTDETGTLKYRRALEALRNGVPNGDAVEILGCRQSRIQDRFSSMLEQAADNNSPWDAPTGLLVSGDFGTGKSHLLTHLEHLALEQGFVCSRVAISKETPLYDLGKVFKSAMDNGRLPHRYGMLIEELCQSLHFNAEEYTDFFQWANDTETNNLSPMFPASLMIYERSNDFELNREIECFWAGDKLRMARVREGLRQISQQNTYTFRAPRVSDLPPQRLRFVTHLIRAAGYKGWVVLLDEIELVGSYSLLQRGRSYAELARWCGQSPEDAYLGLVTVGTVTDDFASVIIDPTGEKKDRDYVEGKLSERNAHLVDRAQIGMEMLERGCLPLNPPTEPEIRDTVEKLRQIYSEAYGWQAPVLPQDEIRGAGYQNRMRYKVRASINQWDLMRHYPDHSLAMEGDEFHHTYSENIDLERESKDDG